MGKRYRLMARVFGFDVCLSRKPHLGFGSEKELADAQNACIRLFHGLVWLQESK